MIDEEDLGEDSGHEFFSDTLWRGIGISQWNAEQLHGKAKTILATGGLILTVMTVGLVGFAELSGVDLERLDELNALFYGSLALFLVAGLFGIVNVVVSMVCSTVALRGFSADNIVGRSNFTALGSKTGEVDDIVLDRCVKMSKSDRYALYRAYIQRLDDLARSNRRMDRFVRLGHLYLLCGLVTIFVISGTVIVGTVYSLNVQ